MTSQQVATSRFAVIGTLICVVIFSLGYFDDPPNGYTGAPGDDLCTDCHSIGTGMQNGSIILNGLPSTIIAEQTYTLSVTVTNPNEIAEFAGFQSVVLDASNQNAGTFSMPSLGSTLETEGGRTYHEHSPAQMFGMSNAVTWTVDWEAPIGSGLITFYAAGNIANGNGNDNGDLIVSTSISGTLFTPLQVAITSIDDVTCFGASDGSLTAAASFGEPPYTFNWSNGASGSTISGLEPGEYTVTVTDNDNTTATATAEINEPPLFEIIAQTVTHVTCNEGDNGQILITVDGGTPPYSGAQGDVYTFANLEAGDYSITLTDANGCTILEEYTITEPPALFVQVNVIIEPDCAGDNNGLISVEGTGGSGEIQYEWSNGSTNSTIQNLEAGVYAVTITDENGCTAAEVVVLDDPDGIEIDLLQLDHVTCAGEEDGAISVDASGGVGDLSFEWSNGASSPELVGLDAGEFTLTVTDENGCTATEVYIILEPTVLTATVSVTMQILCFGDATGSLQVQANGGTLGYGYQWSNGGTTQTITGLIAGTYFVTVTDNNGCTVVSNASISQPAQLQPNATATGESAPGEMDGTATSVPTGGTGGYSFLWSTGDTTATITGLAVGTYTVTVTDANSCSSSQTVAVTGLNCTLTADVTHTDVLCFGEASGFAQVAVSGAIGDTTVLWSNGVMTLENPNLVAGVYTVTVSDTAGCIVISDVTINEPDTLSTVCVVTHETIDGANDGSISCTATGGVTPYSFLWSNGDTTDLITNLSPGTYILTLTDENGCTLLDTAVVNAFSCAIQVSIAVEDALCFGENSGVATVEISGGTEPYTILWSNGETGMSIDSLIAGIYSLTVTDADTCVSTVPFNIGQPAAIAVTVDTVINAIQGTGGAIQITIAGGTPPYTTIWTRNGGLVSTNEDLSDLTPGEYALQVIDAHDCMLDIGMLTVTVSTGIADIGSEIEIHLRPNPVGTYFTLDVRGIQSVWTGMIYTVEGSHVRTIETTGQHAEQTVRIETEALKPGLYYIRIMSASGQRTLPFIRI